MKLSRIVSRSVFAFSAIAALTAFSGVNAAPSPPKEGQFDQVSTITTPRVSFKSTERVTFKGTKFRLESTDPSLYIAYQDIEDGQSYYHFIPSQRTALRLDLKIKQVSPLHDLQDQTDKFLQGATKSGEVSVNGFQCDVFMRMLSPNTKITLYQSKDPRFPYIIKTVMVDSAEDTTRTNMIDNVKLDIPVSDSTFTLPKDTKIVEQPASGSQTDGSSAAASPASVSK